MKKITLVILITALSLGSSPGLIPANIDGTRKEAAKIFSLQDGLLSRVSLSIREDRQSAEREGSRLMGSKSTESPKDKIGVIANFRNNNLEELARTTYDPRAPPKKI